MLFHGNLDDHSLPQLLNLIELGQKTGTLTLNKVTASGSEQCAVVLCEDGMLLDAMLEEDVNLATKLCRAGVLAENRVEEIREQGSDMSDKKLAMLLIQLNYVTRRDILKGIQEHVAEVIHSLLLWDEATFHFVEELEIRPGRIVVPMDLEDIIINDTAGANLHA